MPTTTAHCYLDVPPNDPLPYRVVLGAGRGVTDHKVRVQTSAIQFADGRIDAPTATISGAGHNGSGLNSDQARELASALIKAAAELDGWAR
jgi:hypothetical protein